MEIGQWGAGWELAVAEPQFSREGARSPDLGGAEGGDSVGTLYTVDLVEMAS